MAILETEVYEFLKLFNSSRRALDSIVSHNFFNFSHDKTPNLMVFRDISF